MPPQQPNRPATRDRLLAAAETLARRLGPGQLSLEAVAAEAGVSKGGLLYHFPTKEKLLEALVASHLDSYDAALQAAGAEGPDQLLRAYLTQFRDDRCAGVPPSSGLLAALAQNPQLLERVGPCERDFLQRIRGNSSDPDFATAAFLVIHGLRAMTLLGTKVLTEPEVDEIQAWLLRELQERRRG